MDDLPRGAGDPDIYGYPGEDDPDYVPCNKPTVSIVDAALEQ